MGIRLADSLVKGPVCVVCKSHAAVKVHAGLWEQVKEFFIKLFNTSDWPPRWHCGNWTDFHGWLYIISDLMIWAAYFAIPLLLFSIIKKRKDLPFLGIFWLFIAFILLCGTSHFIDAVIFWWPAYRLSALIRLVTGVVSIVAVYTLYKLLPVILNLRTVDQLETEIGERKKAEEEARHHQVMQQATEELMLKKDEFMSIASHELKTPITSVKASLQLLQRMVAKNDDLLPAAPFIDKAAKQTNKLTQIINDLLDVTRIQAGKLELVRTDFKLIELINECVEQCQMHDSNYQVTVYCEPEITVSADKNRLDQVISNFLTNAFKYSPDDHSVDIYVEQLADKKVKVSVIDHGIGIAEDKLSNLFDRFYRVENTSQYYSGIGLGLYISSEIIKRHNGEIGVNSVFGKGSTFWFTL